MSGRNFGREGFPLRRMEESPEGQKKADKGRSCTFRGKTPYANDLKKTVPNTAEQEEDKRKRIVIFMLKYRPALKKTVLLGRTTARNSLRKTI